MISIHLTLDVHLQILSQHLLIREDIDLGYCTVGLLPTSNCEVQEKLAECRNALSSLRRTQVKIFNGSLGVVEDNSSIPNIQLDESLSIDIIVSASINDNTDVVQEDNSSAPEISQHEEVAEFRYVWMKLNLYETYNCM